MKAMKKSTRRWIVALIVIEAALLLLFLYGFYRWTIQWRLNGPRIPAQVSSREFISTGKYWVTYHYTVDGKTYKRQHRVTKSYFDKIVIGQTIEIVYSPIAHNISGIPGQGIGDFDVHRLPGTFFSLKFLIYVLPALIVIDLVTLIVIVFQARRRPGKKRRKT